MGKTEDWSEELSVEIANDIKRRNGGTMERWKEVRKNCQNGNGEVDRSIGLMRRKNYESVN